MRSLRRKTVEMTVFVLVFIDFVYLFCCSMKKSRSRNYRRQYSLVAAFITVFILYF